MTLWLTLAVNSIALGGLLFLPSAGFSLIFGLMRIPNLMHGSFFMLGAYFGYSLLALLWSEMAFVSTTAGARTDHSNAMMDLLDELDVDAVSYDPDGFDERVKEVRQQLKKLRRGAGLAE